jgi:hypothetical protein
MSATEIEVIVAAIGMHGLDSAGNRYLMSLRRDDSMDIRSLVCELK